MDNAVKLFERRAAAKVDRMLRTQFAVLAATVCTLFLTWIRVIRPLVDRLQRVCSELRHGSDEAVGVAAQVSAASHTLAQGASEQAASIEETSASAEEMQSMSRRNADSARLAAETAVESGHQLSLTGDSLGRLVAAMQDVRASGEKIAEIIKVTEEIAFLTNILALNAAVEAARAGDAGRSFGVVADEVRALAQRCAGSAQDTAALIGDSISKSTAGALHALEVAARFRSLSEDSLRIRALVEQVDSGSHEQTAAFTQIGRAICQIEQVTQTTAAAAEQSAAAAEELTHQTLAVREITRQIEETLQGSRA